MILKVILELVQNKNRCLVKYAEKDFYKALFSKNMFVSKTKKRKKHVRCEICCKIISTNNSLKLHIPYLVKKNPIFEKCVPKIFSK